MTVDQLKAGAVAALGVLKKHPAYPRAHLHSIEAIDAINLKFASILPSLAMPSPARLDYAIAIIDATAEAYLPLIDDIEMHDAFAAYIRGLERMAWEIYSGIADVEPFGVGAPLAVIRDRGKHWYTEGLRRIVQPIPSAILAANSSRCGHRKEVDAWMSRESIPTLEAAARRLGVSIDTLKSIRSDKGRARYSTETLDRLLATMRETGA